MLVLMRSKESSMAVEGSYCFGMVTKEKNILHDVETDT